MLVVLQKHSENNCIQSDRIQSVYTVYQCQCQCQCIQCISVSVSVSVYSVSVSVSVSVYTVYQCQCQCIQCISVSVSVSVYSVSVSVSVSVYTVYQCQCQCQCIQCISVSVSVSVYSVSVSVSVSVYTVYQCQCQCQCIQCISVSVSVSVYSVSVSVSVSVYTVYQCQCQCHSVAKPFPSNCGSLDLLFADFSMILRILSPLFSQQKKRKKKRRDVREKTMQAYPGLLTSPKSRSYRYWNRRSSRQNCFTVTRETERWRGGKKFKGKLCWEIQSIPLFHRSSLCWKDCFLRVQQNTSLTHSKRRRQIRSILVWFSLHVTGNVNKASVVDAEIRAAQSERERNATREPILWQTSRRWTPRWKEISSVFRLFLLICTPHVATSSDMVLDHDANRSKLLPKAEVDSFYDFFNFADFTTAFPYCGKHFEFP